MPRSKRVLAITIEPRTVAQIDLLCGEDKQFATRSHAFCVIVNKWLKENGMSSPAPSSTLSQEVAQTTLARPS